MFYRFILFSNGLKDTKYAYRDLLIKKLNKSRLLEERPRLLTERNPHLLRGLKMRWNRMG